MNEMPSTAMGTLRLMPSTVDQIARFSKQVIQGVMDGEVHPLELLVMLRALEKVSETVYDAIKPNINTAADRYSEKSIELFGATIEKSDIGVKYDYASSGDVVYERRKSIMDAAKTLVTEREQFLRTLKEPMTAVDDETGEVYTIRPPLKRSTQGVKVSFR